MQCLRSPFSSAPIHMPEKPAAAGQRPNIILIDFENVQPASLELFAAERFHIVVFVGAKQARLPFEIVESIQKLGSQAEYVKISGIGPNALDFHIAYCIGAMSTTDPRSDTYAST